MPYCENPHSLELRIRTLNDIRKYESLSKIRERPFYRWLCDNLICRKKDETLLDLGCGIAALAAALCYDQTKTYYVGVDISLQNLNAARKLLGALPDAAPYSLLRADFDCELPFQDASCDCVTAVFSAYYSCDPLRIYTNALRVLRNEGRFVIVCAGDHNKKEMYELIRKCGVLIPELPSESFRTNHLPVLLRESSVFREERFKETIMLTDRNAVTEYFSATVDESRGLWPSVQLNSGHTKDGCFREILRQIDEQILRRGAFALTRSYLGIVFTKRIVE